MKLPAAGSAGPAGLASKEVAADVTGATGNSFPSSATAEEASPAFAGLHFLPDRHIQPFFPIVPCAKDMQCSCQRVLGPCWKSSCLDFKTLKGEKGRTVTIKTASEQGLLPARHS